MLGDVGGLTAYQPNDLADAEITLAQSAEDLESFLIREEREHSENLLTPFAVLECFSNIFRDCHLRSSMMA